MLFYMLVGYLGSRALRSLRSRQAHWTYTMLEWWALSNAQRVKAGIPSEKPSGFLQGYFTTIRDSSHDSLRNFFRDSFMDYSRLCIQDSWFLYMYFQGHFIRSSFIDILKDFFSPEFPPRISLWISSGTASEIAPMISTLGIPPDISSRDSFRILQGFLPEFPRYFFLEYLQWFLLKNPWIPGRTPELPIFA